MNRIMGTCLAGVASIVAQLMCASAYADAPPPCVAWADGGTYRAGEVVTYNGQTYTALVSHTAYEGAGWNPTVGSLYHPGGQCSGTAAPPQPPSTAGCVAWSEGGTYHAGDVVSYQGKTYTALVTQTDYAGTGWNPTVASLFSSGGTCPGDSQGDGNSLSAGSQTSTTTDVQKEVPPAQYTSTSPDTSTSDSPPAADGAAKLSSGGGLNSGCLPGDGNAFMSASPQTIMNTDADKQRLAVQYARAFQETFNFTPTQAAGVVGNLLLESGLNSGIKQETGTLGEASKVGDVVDRTGYGIAQWGEDRKIRFVDQAMKGQLPTSSQCANLNYLAYELVFDPWFAQVVPAVSAEKTLVGAVCSFEKLYEAPLDPNSQERIRYAKNVMAWLGENYVEGNGSPSGDACDYYRRP